MDILAFLLIGALAGVMGGLFGIGGGIVIVPCLVYLRGFSQKSAQGTSLLALIAPVGILALLNYHKEKLVDYRAGLLVAAGFVLGGFLGSKIAIGLDEVMMRRSFAVFLVLVAVQLFLKK